MKLETNLNVVDLTNEELEINGGGSWQMLLWCWYRSICCCRSFKRGTKRGFLGFRVGPWGLAAGAVAGAAIGGYLAYD
jgi:hypothetical protein